MSLVSASPNGFGSPAVFSAICVALSLFSGEVEAANPSRRFMDAFDFQKASELSWADFKARVAQARTSGQSLSLGETHFSSEMIFRLQLDLTQAYLGAPAPVLGKKQQPGVHGCFERVGGLFETPQFKNDPDLKGFVEAGPRYLEYVQAATSSFQFREKNGPGFTDFEECQNPERKWLLYSGLMHQMKFAQAFPGYFPETPIQRATGKVIVDLFPKNAILTIAVYDLMLLEENIAYQFLTHLPKTPELFRAEAARMTDEMQSLRARMQPITKDFYGLSLGREFMTAKAQTRIAKTFWPDSGWMVLVDVKSRITRYRPYPLLDALSNLDDVTLKLYLDTQRKFQNIDPTTRPKGEPKPRNAFYYKKALAALNFRTWEIDSFRQGPFQEAKEPQTEYMIWYAPKKNIYISAGPSSKVPSCHLATRIDEKTTTIAELPLTQGSKPAKNGFCGVFSSTH